MKKKMFVVGLFQMLYLDQLSREEFLDVRVIAWKTLKEAENY